MKYFLSVIGLAICVAACTSNELDMRDPLRGAYTGMMYTKVFATGTVDSQAVQPIIVAPSDPTLLQVSFGTKSYVFTYSNGVCTSALTSDDGALPTMTITPTSLVLVDSNSPSQPSYFVNASR